MQIDGKNISLPALSASRKWVGRNQAPDTCFYTISTAHSRSLLKELDLNIGKLTYQELVSTPQRQQQLVEILRGDNLNQLAVKLKDAIKERAFVDLGCGIPTNAFLPRVIAQLFNAACYIGVDNYHVNNAVLENEFPDFGANFKSRFVQADILQLLKRLEPDIGATFCLCGIEPPRDTIKPLGTIRQPWTEEYIDLCLKKCNNLQELKMQ